MTGAVRTTDTLAPPARLTRAVIALALAAAPWLARADEALQKFLEQTVAAAREKHQLPAVAALVQVKGKLGANAATGVRAADQAERVTLADRWHIGSDTKAITATMIARLVEQKVLGFEDTLAASFPAFARDIDAGYRAVTVAQLLSHTAGLPALTDPKDLPLFFATINALTGVQAQRAAVARKYLSMAPSTKAGDYAYSNLGYIVAGAIAEQRTGKPWEQLVRELVFAPLGIANAGFGPPSTPGKLDQPLGHVEIARKLTPLDPGRTTADNPPALGPAGTIHIALEDWARFAQDQLDGAAGRGKLLRPETYRRLQTPVTGSYALGWGVRLAPDGSPDVLMHAGSNGYWLAFAQIRLKREVILLIAINAGGAAASQALREIGTAVTEQLKD